MESNITFWNPWWTKQNYNFDIKERKFYSLLQKYMERKEIIFFTGVRRSGKTTAIYHLIQTLLKTEPEENILYLSMDDNVLSFSTLEEIYKSYMEIFPDRKGKTYILLDEIQNIENWENWVKNVYDSFEDVKIVVSGSKSYMLKRQSTLLTGRILEFEIYPLSFMEYLDFKGYDLKTRLSRIANETRIPALLKEYMQYGAFPEVVLEKDEHMKTLLAKEYYNNIKNKDISTYFNIRDARKFDRLSLFLISNIAKLYSATKIAGLVGLSTPKVNDYIDYAEMMYLFLPLNHFDYSIKRQITRPRKMYSIDTGLINSSAFQFSENRGRYLENIVFLELKRGKRKNQEIYYYSGKKECDFVIKEGLAVIELIQVSIEINEDNEKREIGGLMEAMGKFDLNCGLILTMHQNETRKIKNKTIEIKSLINWVG